MTTTVPPLTAEQLRFFAREGYLVVEGLVPPGIVRSWHQQVWSRLNFDRNDLAAVFAAKAGKRCTSAYTEEAGKRLIYPWPEEGGAGNVPVDPLPFTPGVGEVPGVRAVLNQLMGEGCWGDGQEAEHELLRAEAGVEPADTLVFKWPHSPEERRPWTVSNTAHIEMYRGARPNKQNHPAGWCHQFQLGAITYLEDVEHQGGGTHLLPRSHEAIHRYFCAHPCDVRTGGMVGTIIDEVRNGPGLTPERLDELCPGGYDGEPLELVMVHIPAYSQPFIVPSQWRSQLTCCAYRRLAACASGITGWLTKAITTPQTRLARQCSRGGITHRRKT
jgi:hypothetical protein